MSALWKSGFKMYLDGSSSGWICKNRPCKRSTPGKGHHFCIKKKKRKKVPVVACYRIGLIFITLKMNYSKLKSLLWLITASSRTGTKKKLCIWAFCTIMCVCLSVFIWILLRFNCPHRALEGSAAFYIHTWEFHMMHSFLSSLACPSEGEERSPRVLSSDPAHRQTKDCRHTHTHTQTHVHVWMRSCGRDALMSLKNWLS